MFKNPANTATTVAETLVTGRINYESCVETRHSLRCASHPRKTNCKPLFVGLKHSKKHNSTRRLEKDQLSGVNSTPTHFLLWYPNSYHSYSCNHLPWALTCPVPLDPQSTKVLKATLIKIHILSDWALSGSSWASQNQTQSAASANNSNWKQSKVALENILNSKCKEFLWYSDLC